MSKIAIIKAGGKQYLVKEGDKLKVEKISGEDKLPLEIGKKVSFEVMLTAEGEKVEIGTPLLSGQVEAEVLRQGHARTVTGIKYKRKTREHKKFGHRQKFTEVLIKKI